MFQWFPGKMENSIQNYVSMTIELNSGLISTTDQAEMRGV